MSNHLKRKVFRYHFYRYKYTLKVEQKVVIISTALASGGNLSVDAKNFPPISGVVLLHTNEHMKESNLVWRIS